MLGLGHRGFDVAGNHSRPQRDELRRILGLEYPIFWHKLLVLLAMGLVF